MKPNEVELRQLVREDQRLRAFKERMFENYGYDAFFTPKWLTIGVIGMCIVDVLVIIVTLWLFF